MSSTSVASAKPLNLAPPVTALLPGVWVGVIALVNVPPAILQLDPSLDLSWVVGLHLAHERHLQWGSQVIWTYGPWGYLVLPGYFYFETWLASLAVLLVLHLLYFVTLALFLIDLRSPPWQWLVLEVLFLTPLYYVPTLEPWSYMVTLALLLHLSAASRWRRPEPFAVLAGCLFAFLALFKVSALVAGVALTVCYVPAALWLRRWRSVVLFSVSAPLAFLVLWFAAGGSVAAIVPYFRSQYELVAGFGSAMSLLAEFPLPRLYRYADILISMGILAVTGVLAIRALVKRDKPYFSLLFLSLPLMFVFFKEAYTRFGGGAPVFYRVAFLLLLPVLFQAIRLRPRLAEVLTTTVLCVVSFSALWVGGHVYPALTWGLPQIQTMESRLQTYEQAIGLIRHREEALRLEEAARTRYGGRYPAAQPLLDEIGSSTVDIFPAEILEAYAYRLNWTPRPVLQSYSGYTPYLDQADASFYSGPGAPEYVLFSVGSIDGRNGLFDEPAAVRVLMDHYEPVRIQNEVLLLRRRTDAQTRKPLRRLGSVTMPLGSEIAVPSSPGHVYADIEVRNSLAGQALRVVFQTAAADIQFGYEDGTRSNPYRLVTATAKDGVLISDHVTSADQLAEVMKDGKPHPIRSFRVIPRRGFDYESLMSVTFYSDA